jgi:hypothetical protein
MINSKFLKLIFFSLFLSGPFCGYAMDNNQNPSPAQVQTPTEVQKSVENSTSSDDTALCNFMDRFEESMSGDEIDGPPSDLGIGADQIQIATSSSSSSSSTAPVQTEDSTVTDDTTLCNFMDKFEAKLFDDETDGPTADSAFTSDHVQNATSSSSSSSSTTPMPSNKKSAFGINGNMQCYFSSKDPIIKYLIEDYINVAKKSIYITAYCLNVMEIAKALVKANIRGITVRVICDRFTKDEPAIQLLITCGIEVFVWIPDVSRALMHHKFALFDDDIVWNGSFNWTRNANDNNRENVMVVKNKELYKCFLNEFNKELLPSSQRLQVTQTTDQSNSKKRKCDDSSYDLIH